MWSCVVGGVGGSDTPGSRHKHAVCSSYPFVYLLGGRQGNLPLKDFWVYDLGSRTWRQQCEDKGTRPPPLQQHSMVSSHGKIFVFGGELCMSNDTPLWIYEIQRRQWKKWISPTESCGSLGRKTMGGCGPAGRRGHISVVIDDHMIVYGGYQDLRGSTGEMWAFNIPEERWRLIPLKGDQPPPRHGHSAVVHDNQIWIYGGMTDLAERNDFWRYDTVLKSWTQIKSRPNPGLLHSHVAVKLHSSMIVFGGERQGETLNDLWRFHFATTSWEKLIPSGIKPQPRSQGCAFIAPSLTSKHFRFLSGYSSLGGASSSSGSSSASSGYGSGHGNRSADGQRSRNLYDGHRPKDRGPTESPRDYCDRTCRCPDCSDSSDDDIDPVHLKSIINKNVCQNNSQTHVKLSISKLSQLNLNHLGRYYNYSMLNNDSTESIVDSLASTCDSSISKLVKSQSINAFKDKQSCDSRKCNMPRDISSVPNFADYLETESNFTENSNVQLINVLPANGNDNINGEDDSMSNCNHRLTYCRDDLMSTDTSISENLMSFSGTENSLSSMCNGGPLSSFTNPNYVGFKDDHYSDGGGGGGGLLSQDYWRVGALDLESVRHKQFADLLRTPPDSGIGLGVEMDRRTPFDIMALEDFVNVEPLPSAYVGYGLPKRSPVVGQTKEESEDRLFKKPIICPEEKPHPPGATRVTFCTDPTEFPSKSTDSSLKASLRQSKNRLNPFLKMDPPPVPEGPDAMYIIGGKEIGEYTVFKRPISVWKFDLPY